MNIDILIQEAPKLLFVICSLAAAFLCGLALFGRTARQRALEHWQTLALFLLVLSLLQLGIYLTFSRMRWICVLPLFLLFFVFEKLLKLPADCATVGTVTTIVLNLFQILASSFLGAASVFIAFLPAAVLLLVAACLFLSGFALIPEESCQLLRGKNETNRRMSRFLWEISAILLLYGAWICYLLAQETAFGAQARLIVSLFSGALFLVLLYLFWRCISHFTEHMTALADRKYQSELLSFMQVIRSQRHDFNIHVQTIAGLLEHERYDECRDYIGVMVDGADKINDVLKVKSPALGAMLFTFQELASQNNIRMEIMVINDFEHTVCTDYELNTIIGNLIQNAIDETSHYPKELAWIQVWLLKRAGNYVVRVTNPFLGEPETLKRVLEPGFSTKNAHEGIGLVTVQRILNRYDGVVFPEFREGNVSFVAQFPIRHGQTDT